MEIYSYTDYRTYLRDRISQVFQAQRGHLTYLANAAQCQPSYMTKILSGLADLSLEQAVLLNDPLQHSAHEAEYFMLLIQYSRAGSPSLREYFRKQLAAIKARDDSLSASLKLTDVPDPAIGSSNLYEHWWHVAILAVINLEGMNQPISISKRLNLPIAVVQDSLQALLNMGYISQGKSGWKAELKKSHAKSTQLSVLNHHANWRMKDLEKIHQANVKEKEFYTSVICVSKDDLETIRNILLKATAASKKVIASSPEEVLACFSWSLYEV